MFARRFFLLSLLASHLFTGCKTAEPVDPLAKDRERLQALLLEEVQPGWESEGTVVIADAVIQREFKRSLVRTFNGAKDVLSFPLPLVGEVSFLPTISSTHVDTKPAECDVCMSATAVLSGEVEATLKSALLGVQQKTFNWELTSSVTFRLVLDSPKKGRRRILAQPMQDGNWNAKVRFAELPKLLNDDFSRILREKLEAIVESGIVPNIVLADLDVSKSPVQVRDVRLRAVPGGVAADVKLLTLEPGKAPSVEVPDNGFIAKVPAASMLSALRAGALNTPPQSGRTLEPLSLRLLHNRFELVVRLWKIAAKPTYKDVLVMGRVELKEGVLEVVGEEVRQLGGVHTTDDMLLWFGQSQLRKKMLEGMNFLIPSSFNEERAGTKMTVTLLEVIADDDMLTLKGSVETTEVEGRPSIRL